MEIRYVNADGEPLDVESLVEGQEYAVEPTGRAGIKATRVDTGSGVQTFLFGWVEYRVVG